MADPGRATRQVVTLALVALVAWLAWNRFGPVSPATLVPANAAELAAKTRTLEPKTVDQLAATFPQQRVAELVVAAEEGGAISGVRDEQPTPLPADWALEDLDPVKMLRWTPLVVTGERLAHNARLNPRRAILVGTDADLVAELLQIYQRQIRAVVEAKASRRQQEMLTRLAAGRLVPMSQLLFELRQEDLAWIDASMKRFVDTDPTARESHRRSLEHTALQRRLGLDAVTTLADGTAWAARHGELAEALATYDQYERFVLADLFTNVVAFFTNRGCLTSNEASLLIEAWSREG